MTPAAILHAANSEGVMLVLTPAGTIKATGDAVAVNRWLPTIRTRKADLLAVLVEEQAVRRWLNHIQEDAPAIIDEVIQKCRDTPEARSYFLHRAETDLAFNNAGATTR